MSNQLTAFNELKSDVATFVTPTLTMTVTSLSTCQLAAEACQQVKAFQKAIEAKRKEMTDPLLAEQRRIKAYADDIKSPLDQAEVHLKRQIAAFEDQQEVIRAAERRKAEEIRLAEEAKAREEAERAAAELQEKQEKDRVRAEKVARMFGGDEDSAAQDQAMLSARQEMEQEALKLKLDQEAAARAAAAKQREWDIKQQGLKGIKKLWDCELQDINLVPDAYVIKTLNKAMVLAAARGGTTSIPGIRLFQETNVSIGSKSYVPRAAIEQARREKGAT